MTGTRSITGSVCVFFSAVMLHSCSPSAVHSIRAPTIVNTLTKHLVNGYRLSCKVDPGGLEDETMVYWLADGEFVEEVYKNISVTQTKWKSGDRTKYLHNKVVVRDSSKEDFHTNFTCVALSPAGYAKKTLRISRDGRS